MEQEEVFRRWKLLLGEENSKDIKQELSDADKQKERALAALYEFKHKGYFEYAKDKQRQGGKESSNVSISRWLGDIRRYFPNQISTVIQNDALKVPQLKEKMLLDANILEEAIPDIHLVATLMELKDLIPSETKDTARKVVNQVVAELLPKLQGRTVQAVKGALNRQAKNFRPKFAEMDWNRTILANLKHFQPAYNSVIPVQKIGYAHKNKQNLRDVFICLDQSGSMGTSVVYSSIFAAILASIPTVKTRFVAFDTEVADLSDNLEDPVDLLFGVQLGGGTYIHKALDYCKELIRKPNESIFVLITDLYEGGDPAKMLQTIKDFKESGVNFITLLALNDEGTPSFDKSNAEKIAALQVPVFACTPDLFPDLIATAISKGDLNFWAQQNNIVIQS